MWKAKEYIETFDFEKIKLNLRRNRLLRDQNVESAGSYGKSKTIDFNIERQKISIEQGGTRQKEGWR